MAVRPRNLRTAIAHFLTGTLEGHVPHLLLTGEPGVGKTHLGVAAYRWMAARVGTIRATWLNVPAFCDEVKATYNGGGGDPLADYTDAQGLVVLDDLFGRDLTAYERDQILVRLLDIAYQNGAAVLATMNQKLEELHTRLARHEVSRLLAHAVIIPLVGERDWRQRAS